MKKIKILMILGNLHVCDGVASYAMNYYKSLNHELFQMDFVVTKGNVDDKYRKLIEGNNDNIYEFQFNNFITLFNSLKNFKDLLKKQTYDIIHTHVINISYFYLNIAKHNNIKYRILHSHTVLQPEKKLYKRIRNCLLKKMVIRESNIYFACSMVAGESLFSNKPFTIINNAIDIDKYKFNSQKRNTLRKKYLLQDKIVIGNIGRFSEEKNQIFLIELLKELIKENKNIVLVLIGDGPLFNDIKEYVKLYNLENNVCLLGSRDDVSELLNMFDVFVMPSIYEGVGIAAIEAQANGLVTLLSDGIPKCTKVLPTTKHLSLSNINNWLKNIKKCTFCENRINPSTYFKQSIFNIDIETKKLETIYINIIERQIEMR